VNEAPRILLVDDDVVDRINIRRLLRQVILTAEIEEVDSAEAALAELLDGHYFCAFVDYRLPREDGLLLLRRAREAAVTTPIVIMTGYGDEMLAVEALKQGAADYLPKSALTLDTVRRCIGSLEERFRDERSARLARDEVAARMARLTQRERQVLELLVEGRSNKAVAAELGISRRTVETHRARVMTKMGARSIADLVQRVMLLRPSRGAHP
jgi:two-component system response regulator FixJ